MLRYIAILLLTSIASPALAGEKSDAKRLAKAIAPFVNDGTFGVGHVDLSRVPWEKLRAFLVKNIPFNQRDLAELDDGIALMKEIGKAGVRDFFYVVDFDAALSEPVVVIPISKEMDVHAKKLLQSIEGVTEIRGAFILADQWVHHRLREFKPTPRPELAKAFAAAEGGFERAVLIPPPQFGKALIEMIPELPPELGGGSTREVLDGFLWSVTQMQLTPKISTRILIQSRDEQSAKALYTRIPGILKFIKQKTELETVFPEYANIVRHVKIKRNKNQLVATLGEQFFTAFAQQFKLRIKKKEPFNETVNNLKQLGLAMHVYYDTHNSFPAAANYDTKGNPLLSWRVHILPFIEEEKLYKLFRLNEPWNSPHNKKLIAKMPKVYESFGKKSDGKTVFLVPIGKGTLFDGRKGRTFNENTDGTSNTLMVLTVNDENAVTWTKPDDFDVSAKDPMKRLLRPKADGFYAAFADGSAQMISRKIMLQTLRALFTRAGGEVIDDKEF